MTHFDVQWIEINVAFDTAFEFLADPAQLPCWTNAFANVVGRSAIMRTPAGEIDVILECTASRSLGQIDWTMHFPDGSSSTAWTRLVGDSERSLYTFILPAPPTALEGLEGGLDEQSEILARELRAAKAILERE